MPFKDEKHGLGAAPAWDQVKHHSTKFFAAFPFQDMSKKSDTNLPEIFYDPG